MHQPYPSAGQMPEPARPEPPPSVQTAVKLMFAGAVVSAIGLVVSLATVSNIKSTLHSANPSLTPTQLHDLQTLVIALAVVSGAIGIGLWTWMAFANRAGKSWARIVATVFFGIDTLFLLVGILRAGVAAGSFVSILIWLIGLGAIILLWRPESTAFFQARRQRY
jgi:hypothetical protein